MSDDLFDRFRHGDRFALARLLSRASRGDGVADLLARLGPSTKRCRVIAVTGSAGVGKSSLVGKLIETIRHHGLTVAVLACDPQSPLSGGALCWAIGSGCRCAPTMTAFTSAAWRRPADTVPWPDNLDVMVRLLEAFGFDVVLIETVGAGQGDTAVHDLADAVVLLLQPETGDDIQWEKAGLLEVADVIVVHKADLPGADGVEGQVRQTLALSGGKQPAVLRVSSRSGEGLETPWQILGELPLRGPDDESGRDLLRLVQEIVAARFAGCKRSPRYGKSSPTGALGCWMGNGRRSRCCACSSFSRELLRALVVNQRSQKLAAKRDHNTRLLELPVESCLEDIDRASVTVERRVSEELVVERQVTALCDGKIIIRFQRLLAGVAQVAVAVQNARAARLQEGLLFGRSTGQITEQDRRCRRDGAMRRL